MASSMNTPKSQYAVLVDAENAQWSSLAPIMEEVAALGADSSVRRIYGDFSKHNLSPWKQVSLELSFRPVNAFSYISGKGSSDAVLIIEAMDFLFRNPNLDGFVLVSSDSDFTPLAQRLREAGKCVIGFGQRQTPAPFVTACERFIYTENLGDAAITENSAPVAGGTAGKSSAMPPLTSTTPPTPTTIQGRLLPKGTITVINKVIDDASDEDGWLYLARFGDIITTVKSDFDVRSYGCRNLTDFFSQHPELFELRRMNSSSSVRIREKCNGDHKRKK